MYNRMYFTGYEDAVQGSKVRYFGRSYQRGYRRGQWSKLAKDVCGGIAMLVAAFITGVALAFWSVGLESFS